MSTTVAPRAIARLAPRPDGERCEEADGDEGPTSDDRMAATFRSFDPREDSHTS